MAYELKEGTQSIPLRRRPPHLGVQTIGTGTVKVRYKFGEIGSNENLIIGESTIEVLEGDTQEQIEAKCTAECLLHFDTNYKDK